MRNANGSKRGLVRITYLYSIACLSAISMASSHARDDAITPTPPEIISVSGTDLQRILDAAPDHSTIRFNRNQTLTLATPLIVRKPLLIEGLNARLPEKLGKTPLVIVEAEGVSITDFEVRGNKDSVDEVDRCALIVIRAGSFRIERGVCLDSSKDGVMVDGPGLADRDIVGGVIRDIVGRDNGRDVVSLGGGGVHGHRIRNVLVDNVQAYDSGPRGAVEVSDGTDNITVRKVRAERCLYAIDVQDHGKPLEINSNVLIEDVVAVDCTHALRTFNKDHGHTNLTIRDITAERCAAPLKISNTRNLILQNVRITAHPNGKPAIAITNCNGVSVRDVVIQDSAHEGPAVFIEDSNDTLIDGLTLQGETSALASAVTFNAAADAKFSGLNIHIVSARTPRTAGILIQKSTANASLTHVLITGNFATVLDQIQGEHTVLLNNF